MGLIRCADCGGQISTSAISCPACGRPIKEPPAPKRRTSTVTWFVTGLLTLGVFGALVSNCVDQARRAQLTQEQRAAEDKTKAAYDKSVDRAIAGARTLREAMRNPNSFAVAKVFAIEDGAICYTYRAQNGFGGMNQGQAILFPDNTMKSSTESGFARAWNKACTASGWDLTSVAKWTNF